MKSTKMLAMPNLREWITVFICAVVFAFFMPWRSAQAASVAGSQNWLALSDIHLNPFNRSSRPSDYWSDSNLALFESAVRQMKRAEPNPSVVLLGGDFLAHNFARHVRESGQPETPKQAGIRTMRRIASALGAAFPHARFALVLGNNDVPCGDYHSADGSAYLLTVARIWAPLVNRDGGATDFVRSFGHHGYYTAALPIHGLRLVALDTTPWSSQYRGNCGARWASNEMLWLQRTLGSTPSGLRNVITMHIPPGYDPFSTQQIHGFLPWPFLRADYNEGLIRQLSSPRNRIAYVIAAHTHRFDYRFAGNVAIVVLGSLSPIFGNNPAFYTLHVSRSGSLRDIDTFVFEESTAAWVRAGSFDRSWRVGSVDPDALAALHVRLGRSPSLRQAWGAQANGWPPTTVGAAGPWGTHWWRAQWCAQSLSSPFAQCAGIARRVSILRFFVISTAVVVVAILAVFLAQLLRRRFGRLAVENPPRQP